MQSIIIMMSFFIMLSVTLSLTQVADATNISASCGYVEHTHTPDCYYKKLTCTNTDPGHTHDLDCFDYVLICGQHAHTHNATCFETKDTGHFVTLLSLFSPVNQTQSDEVVVSMAPKPEQEIIEMPETELVHRVPTVIKEQEEQKKNQETAETQKNNAISEQHVSYSDTAVTDESKSSEEPIGQSEQAEVQATEKPVTVPTEQPVSVPAAKPETHTENYSIHPAEETIVLQPVDLNTPEPEIHDPVEYTELTESIEEEYPAVISYLNISPAVVQPGQSVTFDFQAENAEAYFYRIYSNDEEYESGNLSADAVSFVWNPEISGEYTFALTAYNSSGSIDSETVKGVVYTEEKKEEWLNTIKSLALTGNWTEDLVTVASSQNGFLASDIASLVDVDQAFRGKNDSVDSRFIAFCMNYAGINSSIISDYTKEDGEIHKGDVLFFDYQKDGIIDHMAVVTECSEGIAYVIEVGQNGLVRDEWYSIHDEAIVYYFDTAAAEVDYGTYPLTYEGEDFTVTADAYHMSGIMEDASVRVIEKDEVYENEEPDKKILSSRAYEVVFVNSEEETIVPVKDIHITVAYKGEEQVLLDGRTGSTRKKNTLEFTGREDLTFFEAWYERILKLEAEEGNVKVTFTYSENTDLPLNTRLEIREMTDETEYSSYLEQANEAFETVSKASFYEVGIYEGDVKADPEGILQVEVNTEGKEENNAVYAMHYVDETIVDIADVEKEESIVSFEKEKKEEVLQTENMLRKNSRNEGTETTNVVGIIETVMETKVITADGETYSIEVAYGPEAQLPANAKLSAYEIREDDERYAAYIERMRAFQAEETETSFRLFDI
ncbi:MAG: hypothetical protein IKD69_08975, partial [Solobacterium sp.]|nr:hypothetical protein [Solobacterium sp.]